MTISSEVRKAGPFAGDGITTAFPFTFKVFATSDLQVVLTTPTGVDSTLALTTDYTVSLNADQNANPGGTITKNSALATGYKLTATSAVPNLQSVDLTNNGGFFPAVINIALDKLTILVQQALGMIGRTIKIPLSDASTITTTLPGSALRAGKALIFDSSGNVTISPANYIDQTGNAAVAALLFRDVVPLTSADSPYTVTLLDRGKLFAVNATAGAVSIVLPQISTLDLSLAWTIGIKKTDSSANAVTVSRSGTDTIEGATSWALTFQSMGTFLTPDVDQSPDQWTRLDVANPLLDLKLTGGALSGALNEAKGADLASAATVNIGAATGNYLNITGSTTITAFDTVQAGTRRIVRFAGALTLTHNATSLILPGAANIVTAANDVAIFVSEGSGNWRCVVYVPASGQGLPAGSSSRRNKLFNSSTLVAQDTTRNLSTGQQYGLVDMVKGWASGGAVSAGTITQDLAAPIGRAASAFKLAGVTLTGSGQLSWLYRMEAKDALLLKNQTASFQIKVQHDVGSSINYTTVLRKPTAADNYASTTVIATSAATSVASGSGVTLAPFPNGQALGDVSNGLEIEIQVACGAITTKNFWFTEWQLEEGLFNGPIEYRPFAEDIQDCKRTFRKSYDTATAPNTTTNPGRIRYDFGTATTAALAVFVPFDVPMRAAPTLTFYDSAGGGAGTYFRGAAGKTSLSTEIGVSGFNFIATDTTNASSIIFHYVADSRL